MTISFTKSTLYMAIILFFDWTLEESKLIMFRLNQETSSTYNIS